MRLVIHADDCGLTAGITANILTAMDAGALCGAAVMAGGDCAAEAARALAEHCAPCGGVPALGVHLNILEGRSVCPHEELPLLTRADGMFRRTLVGMGAALAFGSARSKKALLQEIEREFDAQIRAVSSAAPSARLYLDGHLHVHALPPLRPLLLELVRRYPVDYVRVPAEERCLFPVPPALFCEGFARRELLCLWSKGMHADLRALGVRTPDYFIGAFCGGSMTLPRMEASLAHVAKKAPDDALVEVMVHPGGLAPGEEASSGSVFYKGFYSSPRRKKELDTLLSPEFQATAARYDRTWKARTAC